MSSAPEPSKTHRLISQLLLEDGDLRDIVEEFVAGLSSRITELLKAHDQLDWDRLTLLAHQLKGAAGSYGYPEISRLCADLEARCRRHEADIFGQRIAELKALADAARDGLSSPD